jgi:hypothetical protein
VRTSCGPARPTRTCMLWGVHETADVGCIRYARHTRGHQLPAPGATQRLWSPMSGTLISGENDAVLVDAEMIGNLAGEPRLPE